MVDGLDADAYDALVTAAETYRAALVVRLAGEAGLRTEEITRVAPRHLHEAESGAGARLLAVPAAEDGEREDGDGAPPADIDERIDRETVVPASLAADLDRYATSEGLGADDPYVDVSPRRVQMIVRETAARAANRTDAAPEERVTPSALRKTFARRHLVDRDVDPRAVRDAGGWESLGTLDPYLDPLDGEALAAALAVDAGADADATVGRTGTTVLPGFEALTESGPSDPVAAVAAGLTEADRWTEAWFARRAVGGERVEIAATAGVDRATLAERDVSARGPWQDAIADEAPVSTDGRQETGGRPAVAVPAAYEGAVHGALCVVAAAADPVDDAETRSLAVLGRCLGRLITADRWRELLHSDAVTEVEFRATDDGAFLARASERLDCRIELASTVDVDDEVSRAYLSVDGAGPQEFATVVEEVRGVSDFRVIETREDGCSASVRLAGGSLVRALIDHGATVRDASAADGRVRVVADFPEGTNVRPVADGLRDRFAGVRLASKESVARSPRTESALRDGIADRFTDRQWAALSAAYHGGYFDWPRGSTAEEVADAMDVSSPTFHNHLRKAQRALLDGVFEEDGDRASREDGRIVGADE
ncbi:bacterio-opsin activator domain-containing protein [Halorubrum ezzemoulense]|uniref:bacterio-opsin activator domain-containing protein n=1 Tax=Halorubrum ezzemoulense TaxID=337243 RepID=UPI00232F6C3C|nr:bacterio-opsin activator domain-containing protein [Halorubrum ezzemoulense]MDB2260028.1 bacterio-opsin activator domain-containing protein [Halorubrum ezzemoulense]MDB2266738.1 bacterio-opsin activator domain-containing protein [Halorubrum ezzemoulense]